MGGSPDQRTVAVRPKRRGPLNEVVGIPGMPTTSFSPRRDLALQELHQLCTSFARICRRLHTAVWHGTTRERGGDAGVRARGLARAWRSVSRVGWRVGCRRCVAGLYVLKESIGVEALDCGAGLRASRESAFEPTLPQPYTCAVHSQHSRTHGGPRRRRTRAGLVAEGARGGTEERVRYPLLPRPTLVESRRQ